MPQHVALILDGGGGTRVGGVQKGRLRLGNIPLGIRVLDRVRDSADAVLYSCSTGGWSPEGTIALEDDPSGLSGPAAGLQAAARWCQKHAPEAILLTASADAPFLPPDFPAKACDRLDQNLHCVVGAYDGRTYPTTAVWRAAALSEIIAMFQAGPKGPALRDIANSAGAFVLDYTGWAPENPFAGVNTVADLLALEARAAAAMPR